MLGVVANEDNSINCNTSLHFAGQAKDIISGQASCYNLEDPISIICTAADKVRWATTVTTASSFTVGTAVVGQISGLVSNLNNSQTVLNIEVESVHTTTNTLISSLTGKMSQGLIGANVSCNNESIILKQCDGMIAAIRASCYCNHAILQWYWHVAQVLL